MPYLTQNGSLQATSVLAQAVLCLLLFDKTEVGAVSCLYRSYRGIGDGGHMLGVATMDSELLLFQAPKHHKGGAAAATADDDDGSSTAGVVDNKVCSLYRVHPRVDNKTLLLRGHSNARP